MNPVDPEKKPTEKPTNKTDSKLSHEDLKRVCGPDDDSCAPLFCNEEDCFIPGSELDHQVPPTPSRKKSE
jgi:hypothetical protein